MNAAVADIHVHYAKLTARRTLGIVSLLALLVLVAGVAISVGAASFGWRDALRALVEGLLGRGEPSFAQTVVLELRLPRVCMAMLGGAALGLAGAVMQGILKNPLASPFTLGIASAAGFGAALAITLGVSVAGWGRYVIVSNAFVFALAAALLVFAFSSLKGMSAETMILSGVAVMYLFSALSSVLQYVGQQEQVHSVVFWLMGSLEAANWAKVAVVGLVMLVAGPLLYQMAWDLNALAGGDEAAASLGVHVRFVRIKGMLLAALVTASVICFTGTIGFIGLVAPHMSRMLIGPDHRYHLLVSVLLGAIVLLTADVASRTVLAPHVIPIGIMTSFIGVPFFFYLMMRRRRETW